MANKESAAKKEKLVDISGKKGHETTPIVSGTKDDSIRSQRVVRGVLFILFFAMVLLLLGSVHALVNAVNGRQIMYTPVVKRVTAVKKSEEASDSEVQQLSMMLVGAMETYTDATVGTTFERIAQYVDPSLQEDQKKHYDELRKINRGAAQARICQPLACIVNDRGSGYIRVLVPYQFVVISGQIDLTEGRKIVNEGRRMAVLRFVQRRPTPDNKYGLFLLQVDHYDRGAWLDAGNQDFWSAYMTGGS